MKEALSNTCVGVSDFRETERTSVLRNCQQLPDIRVRGAEMTETKGFKKRFFEAMLEYARIEGEMLTHVGLAKKVAKELGGKRRGKPHSASSVSRWKEGVIPDVATVAAIARVLHVDPGWLAFGEESASPAPATVSDPVPVPRAKKGKKAARG